MVLMIKNDFCSWKWSSNHAFGFKNLKKDIFLTNTQKRFGLKSLYSLYFILYYVENQNIDH